MNQTTRKTIMASMFAALCCVATMIIKIPSPMLKGYMNLGDSVVLLSGFMMTPLYGFLAAGIGSALADIFLGYSVYIPATFVIKGSMALSAHFIFKALQKKTGNTPARIISGTVAEIIMVLGYFMFEGIIYGFAPASVNIPASIMQGIAGLVLGVILAKIFEKNKISL